MIRVEGIKLSAPDRWDRELLAWVREVNNRLDEIEQEKASLAEGAANAERTLTARVNILSRGIEEAIAKGDSRKEKTLQDELEKIKSDHFAKLIEYQRKNAELSDEVEGLRRLKDSTVKKISMDGATNDEKVYHGMLENIYQWHEERVSTYRDLPLATGVDLPVSSFMRHLAVTEHQDGPGANIVLFRRLRELDLPD